MIDTDIALQTVFNEISETKEGYIDISEFFVGLSQFVEEPPFDVAKALFKFIDLDNDNFITLNEFKELVHFYVKNSNDEDEYSVLFMKCNEHGYITKENIIRIIHSINSTLSDEEIIASFNENDSNTDGKLNLSEYLKCIEKMRYEA